jgi:hypothetical protein
MLLIIPPRTVGIEVHERSNRGECKKMNVIYYIIANGVGCGNTIRVDP